LSIVYANICLSVQDHRQKFSVFNFKHRFWRTNKRQWNQQVGSLCCKKEVLKTSGSEEADVTRSSSPKADVIRGSEDHQKLKDWRTSNVVQVKI